MNQPQGTPINPVRHSMKRRSPWHNYYQVGTYMVTLVVEGRRPLLGTLRTDGPTAHVELTPLGHAIMTQELSKISLAYPQVELWKACLMPDHIHLILHVATALPSKVHLGRVVAGFKGGCTRAWHGLMLGADAPRTVAVANGTAAALPASAAGASPATAPGAALPASAAGASPATAPGAAVPASAAGASATVPGASAPGPSPLPPLFVAGYNDKILMEPGQLDRWKHYLDDNPRRLAMKQAHPDLFTVLTDLDIGEWRLQAVGNWFLLEIPQKMSVVVHRAYNDREFAQWRERWLACGEAGGVLVSAAVASREKQVMREAMDRGYAMILLRENGFPPLYKPAGEAFDACASGRLLQLSPWPYHMEKRVITREQCLQLNRLAETIAAR